MVFGKQHTPIRDRDAPYYHCLCGIHVHRGTFIIGIIGVIFSLVSAVNALLLSNWLTLPIPIIHLLLNIFLLVGNKKEQPNFYLPYLIINAILIIVMLLLGGFVLLTGAAVTSGGVLLHDDTRQQQAFGVFGAFTITFGIIMILWALLSAYFLHVVFRAYRYLKDVVLLNPPTVADPTVGPQPVV